MRYTTALISKSYTGVEYSGFIIPDIAEDTTHLVAEKSTVEACLAANAVVVKTHSRGS